MAYNTQAAKPFSIQDPKEVARIFRYDTQKIGEAMMLGTVNPTSGLLAVMGIQKERAAEPRKQFPQATIAQQVMGGAPPAQPAAPAPAPASPSPGGLGATPQAAPPMAPPMPQMPQGPGMAAGGMVPPYASGGLSDVPVPDTMFDEPSNGGFDDGYGGGGLVAFARGGPLTDDEAWSRIKRLEGGLGPNGEMRVSSAGAVGPAQLMPATAPEAARIAGLPWDEKRYRTDPAYNEALGRAYYLSRVSARGGDYNKAALDYHSGMGNVDKGKIGPAGREYLRKFTQDSMPERDINTAAGRMASIEDIDRYVEGRFGKSAEDLASDTALRGRLKEMASDEYYEKQRKADMWQTLAEIGFNMASSKSPYLLQAIGEAAAAAMPGARADKKERKALKDRALEGLVEMGARDRKEALQKFDIVKDIYKQGVSQEQFEKEYGQRERQLQQADTQFNKRMEIEEYKALHPNASDLETKVAWVIQQKLAADPVSAMKYLKDNGLIGGAPTNMGLPGIPNPATPAGQQGGQTVNLGGWND